jgi:outer membrane protein OmpU
MNKSKLLATTMIVSAAAMVATAPVSAASLKLGGYYEQWFGTAGKGTASPKNNFDVQNDAEIHFSFKEKLGNGMTVGGKFEMEAGNGNEQTSSTADSFDETSLYVQGSFGKIQIGNNDNVGASAASLRVVGPIGHIKSDSGDWVGKTGALNNFDIDLGSGDAQGIQYHTPKINGLQLAVSYKPDSSDGTYGDMDDRETTGVKDTVAALIKYSGSMGGTKVGVGVGISNNDKDGVSQDGYAVGLSLAQGPLSLTVGYAKEDFNATNEQTFVGAGLIYKLDKVNSISFGFSRGEKATATANTDLEEDLITLGYSRNLGKGVSFAASAFNVSTGHEASTNVDENGFVAGFSVNF